MKKRVLFIEDEDDIREIATVALGVVGGMDVVAVSSGEAGVAEAARQKFDAVIVDWRMPGMDGLATLKELRKTNSKEELPVVLLTANSMPKEVEPFQAEGVNAIVGKPFDPMTLAEQICALLGWSSC